MINHSLVTKNRERFGVNKWIVLLMLIFILCSFLVHLLALLKVFPILFSIPLLFISFFLFFITINRHNKFKGF